MAKGMRHLVIVPMFSYMYVIKEIIYIYVDIARHKHTWSYHPPP